MTFLFSFHSVYNGIFILFHKLSDDTYSNLELEIKKIKYKNNPDINLLTEIYFTCLAGIGIYILYKIMEKSK